ncbi:hypothetical protein CRG98_005485 [Punica granatum]|uniref:DUF7745 domain-containing protein n=1 Tax=Punica granatum TaxID=22663 RepID=A0A2I0L096_PUNGR|nr:hypothetical protein CRG98_005485 [Punica granatum]
MDRPAPGLRLKAITLPRQDIMRILRTLRPVDHAFIQNIIGDVVMLTETPVDWIFLRTAAELWDPEHVVFNFQGTELAPTIEEYTALIQRPTPTTQGIFRPNPFTIIQGQLSTLLHIPAQDIHEELHQSFLEWRRFWRELTPSRFLWVARWNLGGPMITGCPRIVEVPLLSHLGSTLIFPSQADRLPFHIQWADSTSTAPDRFLQIQEIRRQRDASTIQRLYFPEHPTDEERAFSATSAYVAREERDRLRCELVDSRAEVADYREVQTQLTRARARVAHLYREMARLDAELDRVHKRARNLAHP